MGVTCTRTRTVTGKGGKGKAQKSGTGRHKNKCNKIYKEGHVRKAKEGRSVKGRAMGTINKGTTKVEEWEGEWNTRWGQGKAMAKVG